MREEKILSILKNVKDGILSLEEALRNLRDLPYEDLFHTKIDHHRILRRGLPEVIYGRKKRFEELEEVIKAMIEKGEDVLVTRVPRTYGKKLQDIFPEGNYNEKARTFAIKKDRSIKGKGLILIVTAGTADIDVAEEAYVTSDFLGNETERLYDVGVAGIHRLIENIELIERARVIIAIAGMEGALPSIVAGLTKAPVIGVPTSAGYGASFKGLSALLTMLNSCSTVAVFNIDNGFGAAYFASLINRL